MNCRRDSSTSAPTRFAFSLPPGSGQHWLTRYSGDISLGRETRKIDALPKIFCQIASLPALIVRQEPFRGSRGSYVLALGNRASRPFVRALSDWYTTNRHALWDPLYFSARLPICEMTKARRFAGKLNGIPLLHLSRSIILNERWRTPFVLARNSVGHSNCAMRLVVSYIKMLKLFVRPCYHAAPSQSWRRPPIDSLH